MYICRYTYISISTDADTKIHHQKIIQQVVKNKLLIFIKLNFFKLKTKGHSAFIITLFSLKTQLFSFSKQGSLKNIMGDRNYLPLLKYSYLIYTGAVLRGQARHFKCMLFTS